MLLARREISSQLPLIDWLIAWSKDFHTHANISQAKRHIIYSFIFIRMRVLSFAITSRNASLPHGSGYGGASSCASRCVLVLRAGNARSFSHCNGRGNNNGVIRLSRGLVTTTTTTTTMTMVTNVEMSQQNDVEAHLRALCADGAAADARAVFASSQSALALPLTWPGVLHALAAAAIVATPLSRLVSRLGLVPLLSLQPCHVVAVVHQLSADLLLTYAQRVRLLSHFPVLLVCGAAHIARSATALRALGLDVRDVRRIALRWPRALYLDGARINRVARFLMRPPAALPAGRLVSMLRRAPWVLALDVDSNLAPVLSWLAEYAPPAPLYPILLANPPLLATKRASLFAARDFLLRNVLLSHKDVVAIFHTFPPILTCSVEAILSPALDALRHVVGIADHDVPKIVRAFPAVLTLDPERTIRPVVNYLHQTGIRNVARVVKRIPPILGYDVETNIRPKMNYLLNELKLTHVQILLFPAVFAYSLEERIKPRTRFLFLMRTPVSDVGLNYAVSLPDEEFCSRVVKVPLRSYRLFYQYLTNAKASRSRGRSRTAGSSNKRKHRKQRNSQDASYDFQMPLDDDTTEIPEDRIWGKKRFRSTLIRIPWSDLR